jgi:hypothetical protein
MKNLHRFMTVVLCCATLYFFATAEKDLDLVFGLCLLLGAAIFCCFGIMEEQKEEISKLKRRLLNHIKTF